MLSFLIVSPFVTFFSLVVNLTLSFSFFFPFYFFPFCLFSICLSFLCLSFSLPFSHCLSLSCPIFPLPPSLSSLPPSLPLFPAGELLRKKRREKDGHKDPLLMELSRLQEDVMAQISSLRSENDEGEKKLTELEKVALILGLHASDRPRREPRSSGDPAPQPAQEEKHKGRARSRERSPARQPSSSASTSKVAALPKDRSTGPFCRECVCVCVCL